MHLLQNRQQRLKLKMVKSTMPRLLQLPIQVRPSQLLLRAHRPKPVLQNRLRQLRLNHASQIFWPGEIKYCGKRKQRKPQHLHPYQLALMYRRISSQNEAIPSPTDQRLHFQVGVSWKDTHHYDMEIVEMAETRGYKTLADWIDPEIDRHVKVQESTDEVWNQTPETLEDLRIGTGTVLGQTLPHDGQQSLHVRIKNEPQMAYDHLIIAVVYLVIVVCLLQECRRQIVGLLRVQRGYHP